MRALVSTIALLLVCGGASAAADEPPPTAMTLMPAPSGDADGLERSGRHRLGAGIALVVVGVLGWGVSTAGTVLTIVRYVEDARNQCGNGACNGLATTATGLSIGGAVAEVGGLAGGIPLVISGVRRVRQARRLRVSAAALPSGAGLQLGGRF